MFVIGATVIVPVGITRKSEACGRAHRRHSRVSVGSLPVGLTECRRNSPTWCKTAYVNALWRLAP